MGTDDQQPAPPLGAQHFDQWYADMAGSAERDRLVQRVLGLPPELQSTSLLGWDGIGDVTEALRLPPDGLLVDVACGRGGYGLEVARRTGARLVGVDFSAVALGQARSASIRVLAPGRAAFHAGTLVATGLQSGTADGLMCVDAVQFARPPLAALHEFRRVLRSGSRLALTCWEAVEPDDARVPDRVRAVHLSRDLPAAGFADVEVRDIVTWRAAERVLWEQVLASDAAGGTDPAMESLRAEGQRALAMFGSLRRVFATATAP